MHTSIVTVARPWKLMQGVVLTIPPPPHHKNINTHTHHRQLYVCFTL
jgi:hypothetical protein